MKEFHSRKPNRLKDYDYSLPGAYFITICTKDKACIFWDEAGKLSSAGQIVDAAIQEIPKRYPALSIDNYVVMPNHLHILLRINADDGGRAMLAPTVSGVMAQFKGAVTKQMEQSIWQKSFHEHVVRDENDFLSIWEYISNNPIKWMDDELYCQM